MQQIYDFMLPEIPKLSHFDHFAWLCSLQKDQFNLLTLSKIEGALPILPEPFLPPSYALQFVVRGNTIGKINGRVVELMPNTGVFWWSDHVLKDIKTSSDLEIYVLGLTTEFAEMLNIHLPQTQFARLLMRPTWHITEPQMEVVLQYINFLRQLIEANLQQPVLHMVRSLIYYLAEIAAVETQQKSTLSRAEQICGQFLSLVELYCRDQHRVEWYAGQMCLAPKYLSNVLKQTLDVSPNNCIDQALLRQAKSLLSSTSLSIQQISDRLGFQNQSHFGTFFKRHVGCSPKDFRLQQNM